MRGLTLLGIAACTVCLPAGVEAQPRLRLPIGIYADWPVFGYHPYGFGGYFTYQEAGFGGFAYDEFGFGGYGYDRVGRDAFGQKGPLGYARYDRPLPYRVVPVIVAPTIPVEEIEEAATAELIFEVPPGATVLINGEPLEGQDGPQRRFLAEWFGGRPAAYEARVRWGGKEVTHTFVVRAGDKQRWVVFP